MLYHKPIRSINIQFSQDHLIPLQSELQLTLQSSQLMQQIIQRYCKYLLPLSRLQLTGQFKHISVEPPHTTSKQAYMNSLLRGDPQLIQRRMNQLQIQGMSNLEVKVVEVEGESVFYQLESESRTIRTKVDAIRNQIYSDLAEKYHAFERGADKAEEKGDAGKQTEGKPRYTPSQTDLQSIKPSTLALLLNATQEIRLHPSKIQYEYQRNVEELLLSVFPNRSEEEISARYKQEAKKLQSKGKLTLQGKARQQLMLLYGVQKEQQFLDDLTDPLEQLLTSQDVNEKNKIANVISFLGKLPHRYKYYEGIVCQLSLHQLYQLVRAIDRYKERANLSEFFIVCSSLMIIKLVRTSQHVQSQTYYQQVLGTEYGGNVEKRHERQYKLFLEFQTLKALAAFRGLVEEHAFTVEDETQLVKSILVYKQIKSDATKQLLGSIQSPLNASSLSHLMAALAPYFDQTDLNFQKILIDEQPQLFNERIIEILLFFDPNSSASNQIIQKLSLFKHLLEYLILREEAHLPPHLLQKIAEDSCYLFNKIYPLYLQYPILNKLVDQTYLQCLIELMASHPEPTQQRQFQDLISHVCRRYCSISKTVDQMKPEQGKWFVKLMRIAVSSSRSESVKLSQLFSSNSLLTLSNKYVLMLGELDGEEKAAGFEVVKLEILPLLHSMDSQKDLNKFYKSIGNKQMEQQLL